MSSPCGHFSDNAKAKAIQYSINPCGMIGIEKVYDTIKRFAYMTKADIDEAIIESGYVYANDKPPRYSYTEIPMHLKDMLFGIIDKNGSVQDYIAKPDAEHKFILGFIKKRLQPDDYLFRGVITPRSQMRGDGKVSGTKYTDYQE